MKKILVYLSCLVALICLTGCSMDNTPTKKVENFLNSYKNLDEEVLGQMDDVMDTTETMTDEQKGSYRDVLKHQYQDLTYTIKDEVIDGDVATVTAEIEVYDFYKANQESDDYYTTNEDKFKDDAGNIVDSLFVDYRIKSLNDTRERIKYTIDFNLSKVNNEWVLNDLDNASIQKIHGLYAH